MKQSDWTYLAQLARAMRQECVDGRTAGDFIAEIDAHLTESGVDPADEFGPPASLARELAAKDGTTRRFRLNTPLVAVGVMALVLLVLVVFFEGVSAGWAERIPVPAAPLVYGLIIGGLSMIFGIVATRRLDGRSWSPLTGWKSWAIIIGLAVVGTTASTVLADAVLVSLPRQAAVGFVVVGAVLVIAATVIAHNPIRFPAHAPHLKPLRYGLLADRFGGRPRSRPSEPVG